MPPEEIVSNHSYGNLLINAWRACERSQDEGGDALTAILLSAISVEGFLNGISELISNPTQIDRCTPEEIALGGFLAELEGQRSSAAFKISLIHLFFRRSRLDRGSQPYQDYALLVDIRNALAHQKPERVDLALRDRAGKIRPSPLLKRLVSRGLVKIPENHSHALWYGAIQNPAVAKWSFETACDTIAFVVNIFPDGEFRQFLWLLSDLKEFARSRV